MMNIAVALNRKYLKYTYVMLTSFFENHPTEDVRCFILHSELTPQDISCFQQLAEEYDNEIQELPIDKNQFSKELPTTQAWSIETYYRLMLLDLLPSDVDRLLYIDVDTIVIDSVTEYYYQDFEGKYFVVCEDCKPMGDMPERMALFQKKYEAGYVYFNAGVMLWNIDALRGQYSFQSYMELARALNYAISAPDQDLLNYLHWQQVKYADQKRYDLFAWDAHVEGETYESIQGKTAIIHYAGAKPWGATGFHYDLEKYWWDNARKTPFYMELCEEFVEQALYTDKIERYATALTGETQALHQALDESMAVNKRLLDVIHKLQNG